MLTQTCCRWVSFILAWIDTFRARAEFWSRNRHGSIFRSVILSEHGFHLTLHVLHLSNQPLKFRVALVSVVLSTDHRRQQRSPSIAGHRAEEVHFSRTSSEKRKPVDLVATISPPSVEQLNTSQQLCQYGHAKRARRAPLAGVALFFSRPFKAYSTYKGTFPVPVADFVRDGEMPPEQP